MPVDWAEAEMLDMAPADLERAPAGDATFEALPKAATAAKNYAAWQKPFTVWLAGGQKLDLHPARRAEADGGGGGVRARLPHSRRRTPSARRATRRWTSTRKKFAEKRARLEEALRRTQQGVQREQDQASQAKLQTAFSVGATVLGALFGRKALSTTNMGRATTAMRGAGRAYKESERRRSNPGERGRREEGTRRSRRADRAGNGGHHRPL